ncbi:MAG: methyltransferase domain-containing protein [Desulfomonile tiedjei]|nr:methyltransferase domain-containing protein [Desulfomonile tiedjei]
MESLDVKQGESVNGLFRNKVRIIQSLRGYRVCEDAVILAWFTNPRPGEVILDAGTGSGAIAFGLAVKEPSAFVVGLEIQGDLADRARRGVRLNHLESRVSIVRGDVRDADSFLKGHSFDVIVSNPPYHQAGTGRISLQHEKALARHQLMMPLRALFQVSAELLKPNGRVSLIYPASGLGQIAEATKEAGLKRSRVLWIHPQKGLDPSLVCVEACVGLSDIPLAEECLVLYEHPGLRTREAEAVLAGENVPNRTETPPGSRD